MFLEITDIDNITATLYILNSGMLPLMSLVGNFVYNFMCFQKPLKNLSWKHWRLYIYGVCCEVSHSLAQPSSHSLATAYLFENGWFTIRRYNIYLHKFQRSTNVLPMNTKYSHFLLPLFPQTLSSNQTIVVSVLPMYFILVVVTNYLYTERFVRKGIEKDNSNGKRHSK